LKIFEVPYNTKMDSFTKRFIKGLKEYGISYDEILNGEWSYAGGSLSRRHVEYFKKCFKNKELPPQRDKCVCGHNIKENCYLRKGRKLLVLGNCCIKRFVPKNRSCRTCENCGEPHKNRKVNRCNDCREGVCDICGGNCNSNYNTCYACKKAKL
jgi:hypothetical protein